MRLGVAARSNVVGQISFARLHAILDALIQNTWRQTEVLICILAIGGYFIWQEIDKRKEEHLRKNIEED